MPIITLLDKSKREFKEPVSVYNVALDIGRGLANEILAGVVDGKEVDTSFVIEKDATLTLITAKDTKGLDILRHSCAHLLAQAVKQIYPGVQVTIGPVIDDGFYYDFAYERSFTLSDLENIEKRMHELSAMAELVVRSVKSRDDAITYFKAIGEQYKAEIISDLPKDEVLSLYNQGDFTDLCRGPHVPNTSYVKVFKLMRVAGAYWRGDSKNEMLTRVYGTCWADEKQLKEYLIYLEEAENRDHRKIGKALDLFHFQEESPGIAFWHPKGTAIWRVVEDYMRASNEKYGCTEIRTPLIADISMWQKSGHVAKYAEKMFMTHSENHDYAIRPMNCPTCVQVYNHHLHSYRDLPIRMAEFGVVHRNEASGTLHGLLRVRSFTQDDGHIFCTELQIESEVRLMVEQCFEVYSDFGFTDFDVKLALRPKNYVGSNEIWDKSEKALADALCNKCVVFEYLPGEGAFYGPKIEFHLKDAIGRSWQCGTIQLDISMPMLLGASYINVNSKKESPVMLHRAILGSLERFIGVLVEHYNGKLPVWLSPVQVMLVGISNKQDHYLQEVKQNLRKLGIRIQIDLRNKKIGFKIREHSLTRVPFIAIAGEKEQSVGRISVRKQNGTDLGALSVDALAELVLAEIDKKGRVNLN